MILIDLTKNKYPDARPLARSAQKWMEQYRPDDTSICVFVRADQEIVVQTLFPHAETILIDGLQGPDDWVDTHNLAEAGVLAYLSERTKGDSIASPIHILTYAEELFRRVQSEFSHLEVHLVKLAWVYMNFSGILSAPSQAPSDITAVRLAEGAAAIRRLVDIGLLDDWMLQSQLRTFIGRINPRLEEKGPPGEVGLFVDEAARKGLVERQGQGGSAQLRAAEAYRSGEDRQIQEQHLQRPDIELRKTIYDHLSREGWGPYSRIRQKLFESVEQVVTEHSGVRADGSPGPGVRVIELISASVQRTRDQIESDQRSMELERRPIGWQGAKEFLWRLFSTQPVLLDSNRTVIQTPQDIVSMINAPAVHGLADGWRTLCELEIARAAWSKVTEINPVPGFFELHVLATTLFPDPQGRDARVAELMRGLSGTRPVG